MLPFCLRTSSVHRSGPKGQSLAAREVQGLGYEGGPHSVRAFRHGTRRTDTEGGRHTGPVRVLERLGRKGTHFRLLCPYFSFGSVREVGRRVVGPRLEGWCHEGSPEYSRVGPSRVNCFSFLRVSPSGFTGSGAPSVPLSTLPRLSRDTLPAPTEDPRRVRKTCDDEGASGPSDGPQRTRRR